jgi:hypothetical protein
MRNPHVWAGLQYSGTYKYSPPALSLKLLCYFNRRIRCLGSMAIYIHLHPKHTYIPGLYLYAGMGRLDPGNDVEIAARTIEIRT